AGRRAPVVRLPRRQPVEPERARNAPTVRAGAVPRVARNLPAGDAAAAARPPSRFAHAGALSRARHPPAAADALGGAAGAPAMNAERQPLVSVVVPARDEEHTPDVCLDSVVAQHWPGARLEVVVVENGSRDRTRAVAEARAARDARVAVIASQAANHAEAMNEGIRAARGTIVARVDAHSYVDRDYVAE